MLLSFFQQLPWQRLLKFLITGGAALAIDVTIYYVLTRFGHIYYLASRTLSLGVAIIWSFTVNRYWTFEAGAGDVKIQAVKFVIVILSTSLLSLGLMHVGVSWFRFHDLLVLFVVSGLTTFINFSAHSLWSYVQKND